MSTTPPSLKTQLASGTSRHASEQIQLVSSSSNTCIGGSNRSQMRLNNSCHRATYIFVKRKSDDKLVVQKRSMIKDYCPGYYDPTPGGVVGLNEPYALNAERELSEEMGLNSSDCGMKRLFTFYFKNEEVNCWGEAYEAIWDGENVEEFELQEEEVESVEIMSVDEILERDEIEDFTKDSVHAVKLYKQFKNDEKLGSDSKIVRNVNDEDYRLRSKPTAIFFDCDDCLYFDNWKVANLLTQKIEDWCISKKNLKPGKAYELYKQWGTGLLGLIKEGYIKGDEEVDSYLKDVHDVGVDKELQPNPKLRELLLSLDPSIPKYIFTASIKSHAEACLKALGVLDLFVDRIIDTKVCDLMTKHSESSFVKAMEFAGISRENAGGCVFFDDSVKNIKKANEMGWRGFLVGRVERDTGEEVVCGECEAAMPEILDAREACPEIFR